MKHIKTLILIIFFSITNLYSFNLLSAEKNETTLVNTVNTYSKFNPVVGIDSLTSDWGNFNFSRTALTNVNTTLTDYALNIAILPRLEIGSSPSAYFNEHHNWNASTKLNFWRGRYFDFSLSYARTDSSLRLHPFNLDIAFIADSYQLAGNTKQLFGRWAYGFFVGRTCLDLDLSLSQKTYTLNHCMDEYGIDIQYRFLDRQWLTLGTARLLQAKSEELDEMLKYGAGLAYSIFRPGKFFSRPSIGAYFNFDGDVQWLLSTTFYEI